MQLPALPRYIAPGMVIETDLPCPEIHQVADEADAGPAWRRTSVQARQALHQILALGGSSEGHSPVPNRTTCSALPTLETRPSQWNSVIGRASPIVQ